MKTFLSIGHETALQFARQGFHAVLSARNLENVAKLVEDRGLSAEAQRVDVTDALAAFVGSVEDRHGGCITTRPTCATPPLISRHAAASRPISAVRWSPFRRRVHSSRVAMEPSC
ncbi:hypothetical protein [Paenirhodobacter sp.]|uniref:hypothetical protein n=1 Tax=Paenirhodobacter sp. TaxID=1965326 RepID=UPI003B3EFFE2